MIVVIYLTLTTKTGNLTSPASVIKASSTFWLKKPELTALTARKFLHHTVKFWRGENHYHSDNTSNNTDLQEHPSINFQ